MPRGARLGRDSYEAAALVDDVDGVGPEDDPDPEDDPESDDDGPDEESEDGVDDGEFDDAVDLVDDRLSVL